MPQPRLDERPKPGTSPAKSKTARRANMAERRATQVRRDTAPPARPRTRAPPSPAVARRLEARKLATLSWAQRANDPFGKMMTTSRHFPVCAVCDVRRGRGWGRLRRRACISPAACPLPAGTKSALASPSFVPTLGILTRYSSKLPSRNISMLCRAFASMHIPSLPSSSARLLLRSSPPAPPHPPLAHPNHHPRLQEVNEWRLRTRVPVLDAPARTDAYSAVLRAELELEPGAIEEPASATSTSPSATSARPPSASTRSASGSASATSLRSGSRREPATICVGKQGSRDAACVCGDAYAVAPAPAPPHPAVQHLQQQMMLIIAGGGAHGMMGAGVQGQYLHQPALFGI
ncbi:hypothetical protein B0H11DRAFT_2253862 [Mycena galericulata]|nr:hypothetical protein B0H11DRAFT_2253862 [Mycena galericulata]